MTETNKINDVVLDPRQRGIIYPSRIVWTSSERVSNCEALFDESVQCMLIDTASEPEGVVLDFGRELHGGLQIFTEMINGVKERLLSGKIRVRFGESVSEVMGEPNNDHMIHDYRIDLPFMSHTELAQTGFRFVRIDILEPNAGANLRQVRAVSLEQPWEYQGTFECNDPLLNKIYEVAGRTTLLCCQEHIWDGIKRDRLAWSGDVHPQLSALAAVFGTQASEIVENTLNFMADKTKADEWVNGISSYSLWWLISAHEWYCYTGDAKFVARLAERIRKLTAKVSQHITPDGMETFDGMRFLDWSSANDEPLISDGLRAMAMWAMDSAAKLYRILGDNDAAGECDTLVDTLKSAGFDPKGLKQNAVLGVFAGIYDAAKANEEYFTKSPMENMSPWFGGYYLDVKAMAGDIEGGLDIIRKYYGGMLELGATTFWEHFDVAWTKNAGRIDELPDDQTVDVHATYGDHCYQGLRHSLCHGWGSRPASWMATNILGIKSLTPGMTRVKIKPNLGDLEYARGTFPTPHGLIKVSHEKRSGGTIVSTVEVPDGVEVIE